MIIYASTHYPGGSQANIETVGFDWKNNYLCNLLNEEGMNGMQNPARPIAIAAVIILCISLLVFFHQFSQVISKNIVWQKLIKICGSFSMGFAVFLFTNYHDLMTSLSSIFGFVVVVGIIKGIWQSQLTLFKSTGLFCIILIGTNNFIYYSQKLIEWLPIIQKVTFVLVFFWVIGLNLEIVKRITASNKI